MDEQSRFTGWWLGGFSVGGAIVALVFALAFEASTVLIIAAPLLGVLLGFMLGAGVAETIALVGGSFGLDEDGPRLPKLRRLVRRTDDLFD